MDAKTFEEKVLEILLKWTKVSEDKTHVIGRADAISEITSLIEPLLEFVKVQTELNIELTICRQVYNIPIGPKEKLLRQRISELNKQIEK